jgi:hypothetical protein
MKNAKKKPIAANLRSWRVIIIRSKGEYLGSVEAPDRERAEAVAVKRVTWTQLDMPYTTSEPIDSCTVCGSEANILVRNFGVWRTESTEKPPPKSRLSRCIDM